MASTVAALVAGWGMACGGGEGGPGGSTLRAERYMVGDTGDRVRPRAVWGDRLWGVLRDELGVPYVLRYRVARGAEGLESSP